MKNISSTLKEMGYQERIQKNLKQNYLDACKDPEFLKLVSRLKLDEKILYGYTSRIEDCAVEYRHCKNCKNLLSCKNKITGYVSIPENVEGNLEFHYVACKYKRNHQKEYGYLGNMTLYGLPKEMKEARMKEIYLKDENRIEAIKKINEFITDYRNKKETKGIYLYGSFGCGKTYFISALLNELAKDGIKSASLFWPEFLRDLKASFGSTFNEKFERVRNAPLLFIDDLGAEVVTPWARDEVLGPILQYRMLENLPTFFTSNLSMEELEAHLSLTNNNVDIVKARRIMERIKQLSTEVVMISKNLR